MNICGLDMCIVHCQNCSFLSCFMYVECWQGTHTLFKGNTGRWPNDRHGLFVDNLRSSVDLRHGRPWNADPGAVPRYVLTSRNRSWHQNATNRNICGWPWSFHMLRSCPLLCICWELEFLSAPMPKSSAEHPWGLVQKTGPEKEHRQIPKPKRNDEYEHLYKLSRQEAPNICFAGSNSNCSLCIRS